tara:strand:- start:626 stop:1885 length:1260 start_codon:yes stop_codon:yes gene_type:complete
MGFFKKIFKGVGKVFKKIGKGIKKVAMKVGKFMNKIGIVGQIAMAFILPGIGAALMNGLGGMATSMIANTFGGIGGAIVKGAGHVLNAAHKFVTVGKNVFDTVTSGVTKFIGEFGKTALNKIPGINIQSASKNFFGSGGAWQTVQQDIVKNASGIMNPFKSSIKITDGMSIDDIAGSTGVPVEKIQSMNIGTDLNNLKTGDALNFDAGSIANITVSPNTAATGQVMGPIQSQGMTGSVAPGAVDSGNNLVDPSQVGDYLAYKQETYNMMEPSYNSILGKPDSTFTMQGVKAPDFRVVPSVAPVPPETFGQKMYQGAKDEIALRYPAATPIASTLRAVGDVQDVAAELSGPIDLSDSGYPSAPMYVGSNAQDFDVQAQSTPRNFNAFSGGGQFGSQARVYDTILMAPVSTWSRDLSSRFA